MPTRLGEYCVGGLRFLNKYDALVFAAKTNQAITWDFNDAVFSCFDWTVPVPESIDELYKRRAQQLRDKYDYVSLFFSGGLDSTNVLHAFIDNDIRLDEIVMYKPRCYVHDPSSSILGRNLFSEIDLAATPHLQKYIGGKDIKVRTIFYEDVLDTLLKNSTYVSQFHKLCFLSASHLARVAMVVTDPDWRSLYDAGKNVAHIQGADRPMLVKQGSEYTFAFNDFVSSFPFEPAEANETSEKLKAHQHHEFFYWTPDMPKLVIKQAQLTKQAWIANPEKPRGQDIAIEQLFPPHVLSIRNLFHAGKTLVGTNSTTHQWIHSPEIAYAKGVFIDMLSHARATIDAKFTLPDPNIRTERPRVGLYQHIQSKEYRL
jgi:hypothetical protein